MSTGKRKINIGLLPEQSEDYSQYEESELNLRRIIPAAALALIIVIFTLYSLLKSEEAPTNKIDSVDSSEQILNKSNIAPSPSSEPEKTQTTATATEATTSKLDKTPLENKTAEKVDIPLIKQITTSAKVDTQPLTKTHQHQSSTQQKQPDSHQINAVSPVKILDERIKKAQLSSNLVKGMPIDTLSSQILMSEEGIIRVHLYTEMENLRGQNLFHHWYLNGEQQARVRVPINHNHQRSSSSKFINKQMLGKWSVQVLDEQGEAYIEVSFEVVSP